MAGNVGTPGGAAKPRAQPGHERHSRDRKQHIAFPDEASDLLDFRTPPDRPARDCAGPHAHPQSALRQELTDWLRRFYDHLDPLQEEMMYQVVEDTLFNMGMNGKGCLLRAICEMFQFPLKNHGFFGEVLELFFSASRSPHAEKRLNEYTRAERTGRSTGDCFEYQELCPHSFFTNPGQTKWIEAEQYMNQYSEGGNTHAGEKETKKSAEESPAKKTAKKNTDKKAPKGSKRTFN